MNHRPKKKLGQHFLLNKEVLKRIVKIKKLENKDIIEVGPGTGELTKYILKESPKSLICIEKDLELKKYLEKIVATYPDKVNVIYDDIKKIDIKTFYKKKKIIIGNLPYNIATTLILDYLEFPNEYKFMIFMVQKEVADRLVAKTGEKNYGRISVLAQVYSNIKKVFDVDAKSFYPAPKVSSSVLLIEPVNFTKIQFQPFKNFLRKSFLYRRKKFKNNLQKFYKDIEKLPDLSLYVNKRAQQFSPEEFIEIYKTLFL